MPEGVNKSARCCVELIHFFMALFLFVCRESGIEIFVKRKFRLVTVVNQPKPIAEMICIGERRGATV